MTITRYFFLLMVASSFLVATSCTTKSQHEEAIDYYTCPMHPQIHSDHPGQCPICGMTLVPVKKSAAPQALESRSSIDINPVYTQRIGVKTETIQKKALSKILRVSGKIAHDPELWVTQNDYLEAIKLGDASLIQAAELKLKFMGISPEWIRSIRESKKVTLSLHVPSAHADYVEAYLYPEEAKEIVSGSPAEIYGDRGVLITTGTVMSIASVLDMETRTLRVLIKSKDGLVEKPNTFVQVAIHSPIGTAIAVPKSAILFNGDHSMVYVVTPEGRYAPRTVALGDDAGDYYAVASGLDEGEIVVTNGHFLIDSETQIRLGGTDEHQH